MLNPPRRGTRRTQRKALYLRFALSVVRLAFFNSLLNFNLVYERPSFSGNEQFARGAVVSNTV
jgi:hypothetical protein